LFPIVDGFITGLFLQLAIGPVFFYILSITIDSNYLNSFSAILAVTIVDFIYIFLSIVGIGQFLKKPKIKNIFGILSAVVLLLFGIIIFLNGFKSTNSSSMDYSSNWNVWNSFIGCFVLTISSPLTILFWTSIFSSKAIEREYKQKQLLAFGLGSGLATLVFLSVSMRILSLAKSFIPSIAIQILNCLVGITLFIYGSIRIIKSINDIKNRV